MMILVWVLQILLALHTAAGAMWKFSNAAQTVPALRAIPHGVWLAMSGVELLCALGLILPLLTRRVAILAPVAALCISAEMLLFCGLFVAAGGTDYGEVVYWLVVAAIGGFIAWARLGKLSTTRGEVDRAAA